jgi:hypothetical protein
MGKIFCDCSPGNPAEIGVPAKSCFGFTWFDPADGFGKAAGSGDPAYNEGDKTQLVHILVLPGFTGVQD